MNNAPFSLSVVLFPVYACVFVIGGLFWLGLAAIGVQGWVSMAAAAFLTVPFGGIIRRFIASLLAKQSGAEGTSPTAFSFALRLLIGAVIAFGMAPLLVAATLQPSFLAAGLTALLTSMALSLIFAFVVTTRSTT